MKHRRRTKEWWRDLVAKWRSSGAPAAAFATKAGVKASTLRWWSYELGRGTRAQHGVGSIVPIEIAMPDAPAATSPMPLPLELVVGDVTVRFAEGTDVSYVAALARALG